MAFAHRLAMPLRGLNRLKLPRLRMAHGVLLTLAMSIAAFAAQFSASGVPEAAGCSGAPGVVQADGGPMGWVSLDLYGNRATADAGTSVPVATDGFFPFIGLLADRADGG